MGELFNKASDAEFFVDTFWRDDFAKRFKQEIINEIIKSALLLENCQNEIDMLNLREKEIIERLYRGGI